MGACRVNYRSVYISQPPVEMDHSEISITETLDRIKSQNVGRIYGG